MVRMLLELTTQKLVHARFLGNEPFLQSQFFLTPFHVTILRPPEYIFRRQEKLLERENVQDNSVTSQRSNDMALYEFGAFDLLGQGT